MLRAVVVTVIAAAVCALALLLARVARLVAHRGTPSPTRCCPAWCSPHFSARPSPSARWLPPSWRWRSLAVQHSGCVREDAAIGIVFTTLFALGLVLISVTPSNTDLNHILFGNVLGVSWADVTQVAILAVLVAAVLLI